MLFVYHGGWPVVSRERELFPEGGKRSGREIQGKARKIQRKYKERPGTLCGGEVKGLRGELQGKK